MGFITQNINTQESILIKFNKFLWRDIKMEATVAGSHWISKNKLYNLRLVLLIYCLSVQIVGLTEHMFAFVENLMYLTNWGLYINLAYFYLSLRIMKDKVFEQKYWKVAHVLFEVGFSIQLVIFVLYWVAIYPTVKRDKDLAFFYQSISEHGGMYMALFVDKIFNNIKFYKRHWLYLLAFVIIYLTYNITITLLWRPVYPIICWTKPLSFYLASGAIIAALLHFGFGKLYYDIFKLQIIESNPSSPTNASSEAISKKIQ